MKKSPGIAVRLLYAQRWGNIEIHTTEGVDFEVAEMVKLFDQG